MRALAVAVALLFTAGAANADPEPSPSIRVGGGAGYGWIGISPTVPVEHLTLFGSFAVHRRDDVSIRLSAVVEPGRTPHGISMHHTSFGGGIEFHRAAFFGEVGTKLDAFVLVRESKGPSTGPAGTFDESAHFVGSLGLGTYASGGVDLGHFFVAVRIEAGVVTPLVPFAAGTALVGVSF